MNNLPKYTGRESGFSTVETGLLACLVGLCAAFFYACYRTLLACGAFLILMERLKKHKGNLNGGKDGNGDGEPEDPFSEPCKLDCLSHEPVRLVRQIFRMVNKLLCLLRKFLCGIGRIFGKSDVKRNSGKLEGSDVVMRGDKVNKPLKLSGGSRKNKFLNFIESFTKSISNLGSFLGRHFGRHNKQLSSGNMSNDGGQRKLALITKPSASRRAVNVCFSAMKNITSGHVAFWTKRKPLPVGSLSTPKFNRVKNPHFLRMFRFESPKLLLCLIAVECYNFKLRLKLAILLLQNRYLSFKCRRLVKSKRKTLAEYIRHRNFFQGVSGNVNEAHNSVSLAPKLPTGSIQPYPQKGAGK